jgi:hypothetical protein
MLIVTQFLSFRIILKKERSPLPLQKQDLEVIGFFSPADIESLWLEINHRGSFEKNYPDIANCSPSDDEGTGIYVHFEGTSVQPPRERGTAAFLENRLVERTFEDRKIVRGHESFEVLSVSIAYVEGIRYILVWCGPEDHFTVEDTTEQSPWAYSACTALAREWGIPFWNGNQIDNPYPRGIPEESKDEPFTIVQFEGSAMMPLDLHIYLKSYVLYLYLSGQIFDKPIGFIDSHILERYKVRFERDFRYRDSKERKLYGVHPHKFVKGLALNEEGKFWGKYLFEML